MKKWLRRIRGAVLMGLTWAVAWAPVAVLIGMVVDPDDSMDEMWLMVGALPGFLSGVIFSVVLGIAASRSKLDELSVSKFAGWGAVAGLLIGTLPFVLGDQGPHVERVWLLPVVVVSSITLLSAVSAAGSLVLARRSRRPELTEADPQVAEVGHTEDAAQVQPGGRR